jgi:hypothetical protein
MAYRIPEPPLDPPERRLTADDIETLLEEANALIDKIDGAYDLSPISSKMRRDLGNAGDGVSKAIDNLTYALELAREYEEGAYD